MGSRYSGRGGWAERRREGDVVGEEEGMGPRIREDNGWGRAVREPALRGRLVARLNVTGDHKGRRYGGGDGFPPLSSPGAGSAREKRKGGLDDGGGCPRGTPLRRCRGGGGMMGKGNHRGRTCAGRWASVYSYVGGLIIIVMTCDTFEAGEIDSVGRAYYNGR